MSNEPKYRTNIIPIEQLRAAEEAGWELVGYSEFCGGVPSFADVRKEIKNAPVQTRKGWWYISETRKHGRNKLWAGPFKSEQEALDDYKQFEK